MMIVQKNLKSSKTIFLTHYISSIAIFDQWFISYHFTFVLISDLIRIVHLSHCFLIWFALFICLIVLYLICFSLCRVRIIERLVQTSKRSSLLSNSSCKLQNNQVFLSNALQTIMFSEVELFAFFSQSKCFFSCSICARENETQLWSRIL
jgi:hypothetical protein